MSDHWKAIQKQSCEQSSLYRFIVMTSVRPWFTHLNCPLWTESPFLCKRLGRRPPKTHKYSAHKPCFRSLLWSWGSETKRIWGQTATRDERILAASWRLICVQIRYVVHWTVSHYVEIMRAIVWFKIMKLKNISVDLLIYVPFWKRRILLNSTLTHEIRIHLYL